MSFFNFSKKKEEKNCCCSADLSQTQEDAGITSNKSILVLGSGCTKCNQLEAATKEALLELGIDEKVGHITDFAQIASYGVMTTPALVVDNKVLSSGRVLKKEEIVKMLKK